MDLFSSVFAQTDDVLYLGGLFFLKVNLIQRRDPMVENVLEGLYDSVSFN